jgi:Right handed beta helix region
MMRVWTRPMVILGAALCTITSSAIAENSVPELARAVSGLSGDSAVVEIPEGVYTIGSTWVISRPGVTIRGVGPGKTILMRDPQFAGVLVKMDAENTTISNLTLDGNGTGTVISLNRSGVNVDTIEVKNFTHIGIAVPASGCRISKSVVTGFGKAEAPSMGIWHDEGKLPTNSAITIEHSTIKNNGMCGIYCTGGEVVVAYNVIRGNHIIANPGGGQIDIGNAFTRNTVATIKGNTITDGGAPKAGGIELGGGKFTVTGNTIRNHGASGIGLGHNAIEAVIADNTISNCGRNVADANKPQNRSGIYIMYGAANVTISGNRCFDNQANKTQTYGVILAPPPLRADPRFAPRATEHIVVRHNDLRGNLHPEGLLNQSHSRDTMIVANLPAQANR